MPRNTERREEYRDANHHTITNQWNTTVILRKDRRVPGEETTAVVKERRLRIGFFYWLFKKLVQPTGAVAASPPSDSQVLEPLKDLTPASVAPWTGIIEEARERKVLRSLSVVIRLLWHCPLPEEASATGFDFDATVNVITEYSAEYIIKLLKHRLAGARGMDEKKKHTILNTHVPRVMKLVGRSVAEMVADTEHRKEIACPMNTVCNNYSIDNPVLRAEYVNLSKVHKVDTRNSVVPPLASIVNKAMLCIKVVEEYINHEESVLANQSIDKIRRKFQTMKNSLIWYLEQV